MRRSVGVDYASSCCLRHAPASRRWVGRAGRRRMSARCPAITLLRHLRQHMLQLFLIVSRGAGQGEGRTRQRGKIPLLRGWRGAGQGEGRSGRSTARARSRRPTEPTAASGKRSRGAGAGGGGEHSAPARARRCRRGEGAKPRQPRKSQKFSTSFCRAAVPNLPL